MAVYDVIANIARTQSMPTRDISHSPRASAAEGLPTALEDALDQVAEVSKRGRRKEVLGLLDDVADALQVPRSGLRVKLNEVTLGVHPDRNPGVDPDLFRLVQQVRTLEGRRPEDLSDAVNVGWSGEFCAPDEATAKRFLTLFTILYADDITRMLVGKSVEEYIFNLALNPGCSRAASRLAKEMQSHVRFCAAQKMLLLVGDFSSKQSDLARARYGLPPLASNEERRAMTARLRQAIGQPHFSLRPMKSLSTAVARAFVGGPATTFWHGRDSHAELIKALIDCGEDVQRAVKQVTGALIAEAGSMARALLHPQRPMLDR